MFRMPVAPCVMVPPFRAASRAASLRVRVIIAKYTPFSLRIGQPITAPTRAAASLSLMAPGRGSTPRLPHDPLRPEDQKDDEAHQDHEVGRRARDEEVAERLAEAEHEGAQDGAGDDARAADHDHDERLDRDRCAGARVHGEHGDEEAARQPGERRPEGEAERRVAVDVDALEGRGLLVLGDGPERAPRARVLDEEQQGPDEPEGEDEDQSPRGRHEGAENLVDTGDDRGDTTLLLAEEREAEAG